MFEQLLARLARVFDKAGIQYMVIGGQAVMIHGRLRVTEDIDVTLGLDSTEAGRVLEIARAAGLRPLVEDQGQFAGRPQDIQDVRGILARKKGKIDKQYSRQWIAQFSQIEGKAHLKKQLEDLFAEADGSGSENVGDKR